VTVTGTQAAPELPAAPPSDPELPVEPEDPVATGRTVTYLVEVEVVVLVVVVLMSEQLAIVQERSVA
jgi:hypothetical protein